MRAQPIANPPVSMSSLQVDVPSPITLNTLSSSKAPANTPSWIYVPPTEAHRLAVSQDAITGFFFFFLFSHFDVAAFDFKEKRKKKLKEAYV